MLLLTLAGVAPEVVAADYELSAGRLTARYAARGEEDEQPMLEAFLAARGMTAGGVIVALLADLDVEPRVREAGLADHDVAALRQRLLGPPGAATPTAPAWRGRRR